MCSDVWSPSHKMKINTFYKIVNDPDQYCWDSDNIQNVSEDISLGDVFFVTDVGTCSDGDFNICLTKCGPGRILWVEALEYIHVEEI